MKVLWFEVSVPSRFANNKTPIAGWQDSLEEIVRQCPEIEELGIAFESKIRADKKVIDNVVYFPMKPVYNLNDKIKNKITWRVSRDKLLLLSREIIEDFKPDLIHVFGSEWCFGQVVKYTNVPVVVHMQGSIPPYYNAKYPPMYNVYDEYLFNGFNLRKQLILFLAQKKYRTWKYQEEETLSLVENYMGRTEWDKALVKLYHPDAHYYYCNEALRKTFIDSVEYWKPKKNKIIRLVTVGSTNFWKGMDTVLRTAKLLKDRKFNFEWCIVGKMNVQQFIEHKEKLKFSEVNVRLLGFLNADKLSKVLLSSDIYIHTAYIDNSPNSICEAQYLGLPIIATYVGGIPSLLENSKEGLLVPANAPYTLAYSIIQLSKDSDRQKMYSYNTRIKARERHDPQNILNDLLFCYKSILRRS